MFYKLMHGNLTVDILQKLCYVRYLPQSVRWVITDPQSAHGIRGSDQETIYLIEGRNCSCGQDHTVVRVEEISVDEYNRLSNEIALRVKEKEDLTNRITQLENQLTEQNSLLQQILAKLS